MKYCTLIYLFISTLVSCQEKKIESNLPIEKDVSTHSLMNQEVSKMLEKQLEYGKPSFDNPYKYSEKDVDVLIPILSKLLASNGYQNKNEFNQKINTIFNRIIDDNSSNEYLYVNYLDKCKKSMVYSPNDIENSGFYVVKNSNFITELYLLPELINYQKEFPDLTEFENNLDKTYKDANANEVQKYFWKDDSNLNEQRKKNIQIFINRNLYLFNDDKSKLPWLLKNDDYFMKKLVLTFGWTEDEKLLKWVIENNQFDKNNPLEFGKMFYTKKCDGTLKLQPNTFKFLQKTVTPENQEILDEIKKYVQYLAVFSNKTDDLTDKERLEVLSNIVYFAQQYKYEKGFKNHRIMSWMYLTNGDGENAKILKQNNYFNLPKFKQWWDQQYTDGDYEYVSEVDGGARDDY